MFPQRLAASRGTDLTVVIVCENTASLLLFFFVRYYRGTTQNSTYRSIPFFFSDQRGRGRSKTVDRLTENKASSFRHLPESVVRGVCPEHEQESQGSRHDRVRYRRHLPGRRRVAEVCAVICVFILNGGKGKRRAIFIHVCRQGGEGCCISIFFRLMWQYPSPFQIQRVVWCERITGCCLTWNHTLARLHLIKTPLVCCFLKSTNNGWAHKQRRDGAVPQFEAGKITSIPECASKVIKSSRYRQVAGT